MAERSKAIQVLTMNTLAFTVCFACWMLNGVLVTFLVENGVFHFSESQIGWLIGVPVLTGSVIRLPAGILADRYGGRLVFAALMLIAAVPMYLLSHVQGYKSFLLASFGFGLAGASFAVGIAYTSVWFSKERQGTALGIFGAGNAGSALTTLFAPRMLLYFTSEGTLLDGWRTVPRLYAAALLAMTIIFLLFTHPKRVDQPVRMGMMARLEPLKYVRVWRFGFYYFLVFGGFVALAQWLVPYYVSAYAMSITMAGLMTSIFSLPSGLIRALGGWMSDHYGARRVMYWVLGACVIGCTLLIVPRMNVELPGRGVMAARAGTVEVVTDTAIIVSGRSHRLHPIPPEATRRDDLLVFPVKAVWQSPVVQPGDEVEKRQLLAAGVTQIHFQANVWIFTAIVFVVGFMMGIGKAAVYRHIPDYFPNSVGVVGGMVGVIGGLGGFVCPIIFGYLLEWTGIWTTCWMFLAAVSIACLLWMHIVIQRMMREQVPALMRKLETASARL